MRSLAIAASVVKTAAFRQIFDSRLPPDGLGIQTHQIQEFRGDVTPQPAEPLDFVDLRETIDKYPSELSGGMRRRVGIARASVTKPPLMPYDSPTAGLDPITAYRMIALVIRQRDTRNTTSLVVTHRYQDGYLLANCSYDARTGKLTRTTEGKRPTRFTVLRDGRKVFEGPEAELLASKDPYVSKFTRRPRRPGRTTDGQATGVQQRDETGILGRLYSSEMPGRA